MCHQNQQSGFFKVWTFFRCFDRDLWELKQNNKFDIKLVSVKQSYLKKHVLAVHDFKKTIKVKLLWLCFFWKYRFTTALWFSPILRWKSDFSLSKAVSVCFLKKLEPKKRGFRVIWQTQVNFHIRSLVLSEF